MTQGDTRVTRDTGDTKDTGGNKAHKGYMGHRGHRGTQGSQGTQGTQKRIHIWLAANKLILNMTKTEFLLIGSRQRLSTLERNPIIEINQFRIKQVSTSKSLSVHIDGNLSWECHINEISKKIASDRSAIKRIGYFLPFEILLKVYNSLVQPRFDYCNVVWGNCSKSLFSKLQKLQSRVARILTFSNYDCSTSELFQNLNWSKLVHQHVVSKAIMMHRCK